MTIVESIPDYGLARSPLFYYVHDVNNVNAGFYYYADVYVWSGTLVSKPGAPSIRLSKYKDANNCAAFDVANIVNAYLDDLDDREDALYNESGVAWVSVEFGYYDTATGDNDAEATSDTTVGVKGFSEYLDGINYDFATHLNDGDTYNRWLTDRYKTIRVFSGNWLTVSLPYSDTLDVAKVKLWDDNSNVITYDLATDIGVVADSKEKVLIFPVGYEGTIVDPADFTSLKAFNAELSPTKYYYIQGFLADGITARTEKITFEIAEACTWGVFNVQFLNKYGVWDFLQCEGRKRDALKVTREEVFRTPVTYVKTGVTMDTALGQYQSIARAREGFTVATGWLNETDNELVKQLLISGRVLDATTRRAVNITVSNFEEQTQLGEKLINYELTFTHAHDYINTVK